MARKLLLIGDVAIEILMKLKKLPSPGEVCKEDSYLFLPGGPAGNAALAATFFGVDAFLCSRVGKDGNATRLKHFFADKGVNVDALITDEEAQTGMLVSFAESGNDTPRGVQFRGACAKMTADDVDLALRQNPDAVYLSPETDGYIAVHTVEKCDVFGIPVFLNASEDSLLRTLSMKGALVKALYTTDEAAERFTSMPVSDVETALKCTLTIAQKITADFYVIRMRNRGLFLYDGRTYGIIFVSDTGDKAPTVGFADIEGAVLAATYMVSDDPKQACGYAAIADILARQGKGFRIPTREEAVAYIQKNELPYHT